MAPVLCSYPIAKEGVAEVSIYSGEKDSGDMW